MGDRVFVVFPGNALALARFAAFRTGRAWLACGEMSRVLTAAGAIVDRIKINSLTREMRDGRAVWIKRRRVIAGPVMALANGFFRVVGNPVRALTDRAEWQRWEVDCFLQLHGENYRAFRCGERAVGADELPGRSLSQHLDAGSITEEMLAAAGRELRRAHEWRCPEFGGAAWSHGDPHSGNFIFHPTENRARLIDFEVMHRTALSAGERHADDLLVLLQDLLGRIAADRWQPCASAFLETYDRPEIIAQLAPRLVLPSGPARIWWAVRTTYLPRAELARRLAELRASLRAAERIPHDDPLPHGHAAE